MHSWTALLSLSLVAVCNAQFGFGNNFGNFGGGGGFNNMRSQKFHERFDNAGGNAAGAGQASALQGTATSINTANHQAGRGRTSSNALSANTASGIGPSASGAAQAGGQTSSGRRGGSMFERNQGFFRRKRQAWGFPGGFGFGSGAQANSLGGGSAMFGNVETNNLANTFSSPWGASGMGMGNARGSGYGVNIWNAATSNSFTGRKKRQAFDFNSGFNGFNGFNSAGSQAGALGGANTMFGNAFTNNNAFTNSNPWGASGSAFGNAGADGPGSNAWNAASSSSFSNGF
ncbi:uncharacterized PPE family protein PPE40-like [Paramacrobiotus metropolitanus]|uniref:uncharacterized PPE family protein PPE40-like n=1 Tax=Paramacrobiotus metropolitanus TaxID=2943436 RepID=UPI002445CE24|nr:uncharacterized PPE family protein PPE40-like [Paramacrobiotus metropolitanus]